MQGWAHKTCDCGDGPSLVLTSCVWSVLNGAKLEIQLNLPLKWQEVLTSTLLACQTVAQCTVQTRGG